MWVVWEVQQEDKPPPEGTKGAKDTVSTTSDCPQKPAHHTHRSMSSSESWQRVQWVYLWFLGRYLSDRQPLRGHKVFACISASQAVIWDFNPIGFQASPKSMMQKQRMGAAHMQIYICFASILYGSVHSLQGRGTNPSLQASPAHILPRSAQFSAWFVTAVAPCSHPGQPGALASYPLIRQHTH